MTKKIIILIIVLCAGLLFLFYILLRGSRNIFTDPYSVIPDDAGLFVETFNFPALVNSVSENNGILNDLTGITGTVRFAGNFNALRGFLNRNDFSSILENQKAVLSFHITEGGRIRPLLVLEVPENIRAGQIEGLLKKIPGAGITKGSAGKFRINTLTWINNSNKYSFSWCFMPGLALFSTSRELVAKALDVRNKGNNIRSLSGISRLVVSANNREDKIFIVFRNLKPLVAKLEGARSADLAENISGLTGGAEADMVINENGYLFSGFVDNGGEAGYILRHKPGGAAELSAFRRLPAGCILIESLIIPATISENLKTKDNSITAKFLSELLPAMDGEIVRAVAELKKDTGATGHLFIYQLRNRDVAEHVFRKYFEAGCIQNNMKEENMISYFRPDEQIKIPVYSTPFKGMAAEIFGRENSFMDTLVAFYENFMVSSSSRELIDRFLYDNILNKTLSTDAGFRDFETTLPSRASYFFYCKPASVVEFLRQYLGDTLTNRLIAGRNILKRISSIGYKYLPGEDMIYHMLSVRYGGEVEDETGTEWETKLEGAVVTKPFFFTNHNTGAKEIVVQDDRNNLYLINAAGRILWKIEPGERVNGNFFMIDFYGNNKYQILFAGQNALYLYDRNGNPVERFPVKLRSPASGPPALFDYDNNRNYRIFIPGEDRYIYAYDKFGNVVRGWKPFKTNGPVRSEIKFFRVSGKDYIVAADDKSLYFLDRTGNIRLRTMEPVTVAAGSQLRLNKSAGNSLMFTGPDGTVHSVSFDGKVTRFSTGKFSENHSFDLFDIDSDGYEEYLFIDLGKLYLYDNDRTEMFIHDFGTEKISGPVNFIFSATNRKTGVYDYGNNLVYLIGKSGNIMEGFPLKGYSLFSAGKFAEKGNYHLIVGGNNNFLYNYKLITEGND